VTSPGRRQDAARNRQRIVETAQQFVAERRPLRLNDVARAASVGVATVYRHFPTPEALLETVARPTLEQLALVADRALTEEDPWSAFADFLLAGIDAQLVDAALQPVIAAATHALPETTALVSALDAAIAQLLDRARGAGAVRVDVTQQDVVRLSCGVVVAATVHASEAERAPLTRRYLDVVLAGLRSPGPGA
jgi:AcrR family transcriptional regulator